MGEITPTFHGEMQLAGWSESHNGGCKVTFWLQSSEDLDAFRALTVRKGNTAGQRFMAALVEVGDDEQPVQQAETEKAKGGPLAKLAAQWCSNAEFRRFAASEYGAALRDEDDCAEWIRHTCGDIKSRSELDHDPIAAKEFHEIRGAWIEWQRKRGAA
jgi:hypothetical protein